MIIKEILQCTLALCSTALMFGYFLREAVRFSCYCCQKMSRKRFLNCHFRTKRSLRRNCSIFLFLFCFLLELSRIIPMTLKFQLWLKSDFRFFSPVQQQTKKKPGWLIFQNWKSGFFVSTVWTCSSYLVEKTLASVASSLRIFCRKVASAYHQLICNFRLAQVLMFEGLCSRVM